MPEEAQVPRLTAEPVDIIFLVDVSGSMAGDAKIQSLNAAMEEAVPFMRESAAETVGIEPRVKVATFGRQAHWRVSEPTPLAEFWWDELEAEPQGLTEAGAALALVTSELDQPGGRLPPAMILLSDGMPTDTVEPSFADGLAALDRHPIGRSSTRVAVAIGADAHMPSLESFVEPVSGQVLDAHDPHRLTELLRLAGATVLEQASEPIW